MPRLEKPRELHGRTAPQKGHFALFPEELINRLPEFRSLAEMKVVLYAFWHTYRHGEYDSMKRITLDEFEHGRKATDGSRLDRGTGLSRSAIQDGIKEALADGLLYQLVDDQDKARLKCWYAIALYPETKREPKKRKPRGSNLTPRQGSQVNTPEAVTSGLGGVTLHPSGSKDTPRSEKESLEITFKKDPLEKGAGDKEEKQKEDEETQTMRRLLLAERAKWEGVKEFDHNWPEARREMRRINRELGKL